MQQESPYKRNCILWNWICLSWFPKLYHLSFKKTNLVIKNLFFLVDKDKNKVIIKNEKLCSMTERMMIYQWLTSHSLIAMKSDASSKAAIWGGWSQKRIRKGERSREFVIPSIYIQIGFAVTCRVTIYRLPYSSRQSLLGLIYHWTRTRDADTRSVAMPHTQHVLHT